LSNYDCRYCEEYEKDHQNYCRVCGHDLREGLAKLNPVPIGYAAYEIYCGFCGKLREKDCRC
jgi:hypothetical protein